MGTESLVLLATLIPYVVWFVIRHWKDRRRHMGLAHTLLANVLRKS